MSRRIHSLQVRAASSSVPRPTTRYTHSYSFTFTNMDDDYPSLSSAANARAVSSPINSPRPAAAAASPATPGSGIPPPPPRNPTTPTSVWDPSRGIVFAPSSTSPKWTPPLSRGFATSSQSSFPEAASRSTPRIRRYAKNPPDWAALMNMTADGKEKPYTTDGKKKPSGSKEPESTASPDTFSPLNDTTALYNALEDDFDAEAAPEEQDEQLAAALEEDELQGEVSEAPAVDIERVSTPEGEEIILWKKQPIVYTDETDEYVPLDFQISEETLEQEAEVGVKLFGVENYLNADGKSPEIHYVTDVEKMETVIKLFEGEKVIGFDMEWHPRKILRPPENDKDIRLSCSVIQVASADKVAIFHLAKYPATTKTWLSPTFKKILQDPEVLKTGVSVRFDLQRLATVINVSPAGALELGEFHSLLFAAQKNILEEGQKLPASLAGLCQHHLGFPLFKGDVRTSDWSGVLNANQKKYAADDAYASFRVFDEMEKIRRSLDPRPALPPTYSMVHEEVVEAWHKKVAKQLAEANSDTPKKKTVIRIPKKDLNPDLEEAYEWVKAYAKTVPGEVLKATVADLRCYTMWHNQSLDVEEVASKCRNPPLTDRYVSQKILEAIHLEKLPYNPRRLSYVFKTAPKQGIGRYYDLKAGMIKTLAILRDHPERADELIPKPAPKAPKITTTGTRNPETEKDDPPARVREVSKLRIRHITPGDSVKSEAEAEAEAVPEFYLEPEESTASAPRLVTSQAVRREAKAQAWSSIPGPSRRATNEPGDLDDDDKPLATTIVRRVNTMPKSVDGPVDGSAAVAPTKPPPNRAGPTAWRSMKPVRPGGATAAEQPAEPQSLNGHPPKTQRITPASPWLMKTIKFGVSGELGEAVGGLSSETRVRFTDGTEVDDEDLLVPPPPKRERKVFVPRRRKVEGEGGN
ncbi:hypothetical protein TWF696_007647 [Orbilia brochopaga]|uniref:3'-5' exonuclease domain-containing protein n=1 Tax=Orbilia brochopaga TaxID=3140254 RepID=A0AAV9UL40_9PEZI